MSDIRTIELPKYKCHKEVRAAKITHITKPQPGLTVWLVFGDLSAAVGGSWVGELVSAEWMAKHKPEVGGYFVRYADEYASYSPAKAFEEGYSLIGGTNV